MNVVNPLSELAVILNLCAGTEKIQTYLLGVLKSEHFGVPAAQEIFNRINIIVGKGRGIPSFQALVCDMSLSDEAQDLLSTYKKCTKLKTVDEAKQFIDVLNSYRIARICFDCTDKTLKLLEDKQADVYKVIQEYEKAVNTACAINDSEDELIHIGQEGNSHKLVDDIINGRITSFIPTGFGQFDKLNGGFRRKGLIIIASSTSGGKSTMALQLLINMYRQGFNVALASLEMDQEELISRILANIARVDSVDILFNRASEVEKIRMTEAWKAFDQIGKDKNCRFSLFTPTTDVGIKDVCYGLGRFKFDVLIVDYISLLSDSVGEESWRSLGEIARFMKMYAKAQNMVGVLLCQLSKENEVRYSRTIVEHADNVWSWKYSQEIAQESNHVITVQQMKARNQQRFDFELDERFQFMQLTDHGITQEDLNKADLTKVVFDEEDSLEDF